jgi:ribonuclease BN (tRNA processing enzyme)
MNLVVLGSGTGWVRLERNAPGYLVEKEGFVLILDFGPGILKQILKIGKKLEDISAIFLSHFHPDHTAELIPFFFATRYNLGYFRTEPIYLFAGKGFIEFYKGLKSAYGKWVEPPEGLLVIKELPIEKNYQFEIGPFKAKIFPVKHNPESIAIRLESEGKSLVYSGDTGYCENIVELAEGADVLILECSNLGEVRAEHHLSPEEAGMIAEKARVKKLIISHIYPHSDVPELKDLAKKEFSGEIIIAKDLLDIKI